MRQPGFHACIQFNPSFLWRFAWTTGRWRDGAIAMRSGTHRSAGAAAAAVYEIGVGRKMLEEHTERDEAGAQGMAVGGLRHGRAVSSFCPCWQRPRGGGGGGSLWGCDSCRGVVAALPIRSRDASTQVPRPGRMHASLFPPPPRTQIGGLDNNRIVSDAGRCSARPLCLSDL